jgi:digalactosyldiacylglycerol synthase
MRELVDLSCQTGESIHVYGAGQDLDKVKSLNEAKKGQLIFHGSILPENMEKSLRQYKTFVNLSFSEVLCTTILEALCLGKFVILPICPANKYFLKFKNCVFYHDKHSLLRAMKYTKQSDPCVENAEQFMAPHILAPIKNILKCDG